MRGLPCIRDTRVTVSVVLSQLAGASIDVLEYAAAGAQERELAVVLQQRKAAFRCEFRWSSMAVAVA